MFLNYFYFHPKCLITKIDGILLTLVNLFQHRQPLNATAAYGPNCGSTNSHTKDEKQPWIRLNLVAAKMNKVANVLFRALSNGPDRLYQVALFRNDKQVEICGTVTGTSETRKWERFNVTCAKISTGWSIFKYL